jgi:hypothetical protein
MRTVSRGIGFAVCLAASPEEDLQIGKVYRILPDAKAAEVSCLRVVDDSGEDYLYACKRFILLDVPQKLRGRLLKAIRNQSDNPNQRIAQVVNSSGNRAAR